MPSFTHLVTAADEPCAHVGKQHTTLVRNVQEAVCCLIQRNVTLSTAPQSIGTDPSLLLPSPSLSPPFLPLPLSHLQGTQGYYRTEALVTVSTGFSTEGDRLGTSEVRCATTGGRRQSVAETHSTPSREGFAARRFRTRQTFPSPFHASVSAVDASTTLPRNQTCTNEPCRQ